MENRSVERIAFVVTIGVLLVLQFVKEPEFLAARGLPDR
jgi:hypothetical protein